MTKVLPVAVRPRERILAAARDLFNRHGVRGVGVELIAEAAGTNKMTLYRHFQSKDELVLAYVRDIAADAEAMWTELAEGHPGKPMAQLQAWLMLAAECVTDEGHGCELANAAVALTEDGHIAQRLIEKLKIDQHHRLAALCRAAGIAEAEALADALMLLMEGARVSRLTAGEKGPGADFLHTAKIVIQSFGGKSGSKPGSRLKAPATRRKRHAARK